MNNIYKLIVCISIYISRISLEQIIQFILLILIKGNCMLGTNFKSN